jgi:hypothetical protein
MQTIVLTRGDAGPTSATFRMRKVGAASNAYSTACTHLNSTGRCRVPFTAPALATTGQYEAEVYITGLGGGPQTTEQFVIAIRPSLA